MNIPEEQLHGKQSLSPNWPYQGQIKFHNVTMRYMPSLPPALRDITFTIEGGTQVGNIFGLPWLSSSVLNFPLWSICLNDIHTL